MESFAYILILALALSTLFFAIAFRDRLRELDRALAREAHHHLQGGVVSVQEVELLLCEIADRQALARGGRARHDGQDAGLRHSLLHPVARKRAILDAGVGSSACHGEVFTDPAHMLVEAAQPSNVDTVMVDGRILLSAKARSSGTDGLR